MIDRRVVDSTEVGCVYPGGDVGTCGVVVVAVSRTRLEECCTRGGMSDDDQLRTEEAGEGREDQIIALTQESEKKE